jgi:hypothetical protein
LWLGQEKQIPVFPLIFLKKNILALGL